MSAELIAAVTQLTEIVNGQNERISELEKNNSKKRDPEEKKGPTTEDLKSFKNHMK